MPPNFPTGAPAVPRFKFSDMGLLFLHKLAVTCPGLARLSDAIPWQAHPASRRVVAHCTARLRDALARVVAKGGRVPCGCQVLCILGTSALCTSLTLAEEPPLARTLNTPRTFRPPASVQEWHDRAREIREQILVSAGLWPSPKPPPVRAVIFDRSDQDGYSVEKVLVETWPGFYLAGNLYRPRDRGPGPFPAVLNPHGHWARGRVTESPDGSIPARCIHFARQGMVAFAYDMVGYCDTFFVSPSSESAAPANFYQRHRAFPTNELAWLWNVNLLGFQLWNGLRALDFLESLPDVDTNRIGVTGASGGATQTFLLAAVDDRPRVLGPVCMVSHTMQGGCACENAPGLRVRFSNMDFAAAAAPRPQILVAATGDWTRSTLEVEGPAIESVYQLLGVPERLRYLRLDAGHNYNRASREAVYAWFERWLLGRPDRPRSVEADYNPLPEQLLLIGSNPSVPRTTLSADGFLESWIRAREEAWRSLWPRRRDDLPAFQRMARPLWHHTLQLAAPEAPPRISFSRLHETPDGNVVRFEIRYPDESGFLEGRYYVAPRAPRSGTRPGLLILWISDPAPKADAGGAPPEAVQRLLRRGHHVITVNRFTPTPTTNYLANLYPTYNRTPLQARVRDLVTVCTSVATLAPVPSRPSRRVLWGEGAGGLWALLAVFAADAVVADLEHRDFTDPERLMQPDLFCPGFLAMGGVATPALLAAPQPLLIARPSATFPTEDMRRIYRELGYRRRFQVLDGPLDVTRVLDRIGQL